MRRDLAEAVRVLLRHDLDLVSGNIAGLAVPLAAVLSAQPMLADTIAALVSTHSPLANRERYRDRRPRPP